MGTMMKKDVGVKTEKKAPQKLKTGGPVKRSKANKKSPQYT